MPDPIQTPPSTGDLQKLFGEIGGAWGQLKDLPQLVTSLKGIVDSQKGVIDTLTADLASLRKGLIHQTHGPREKGKVSNGCAKWLGARAIVGGAIAGKLNHMAAGDRDRLIDTCKSFLGIDQKATLTSSDIPLPVDYGTEISELVAEYGTARMYGTVYPLGSASTQLPKLGTSPAFGFIGTSQATGMGGSIGEKSPTIGTTTFTPQKAGGIVRFPSEIEAEGIVALGQFIARYIAREAAKWEDMVFWLADGTSTYNSQVGITKAVVTNSKTAVLASTKTANSDVTLAKLRELRSKIASPALARGAYYLHVTFEQALSAMNASGDKPYIANGINGASLDGFPIRWVEALPAYSTSAAASQVFGIFGDPSYYYLGMRSQLTVETSSDVYFATDELAVRPLWRFCIGEMATDACAGIRTAAS